MGNQYPIRSLAYRDYRETAGGAGGINYLLEMHNNRYNILPRLGCRYRRSFVRGKAASCINRIIKRAVQYDFADLVSRIMYVRQAIRQAPRGTFFIAHDVFSARALAENHRPYMVVYHHQGSLTQEAISRGGMPSQAQKDKNTDDERAAFSGAVKVVFPSRGAAASYCQTSDLPVKDMDALRDKTEIIYNTCMLHEAIQRPCEFKVIERLVERGGRKKIILTVSSLMYATKGVDQIPGFLAGIQNFKNDFIWVCCGSGAMEGTVRERIKDLGLENHVIHIKRKMPRVELYYLFEKASYYLMMHRLSVFDLTTLEAMSHGCVPLLSSVGGNLEVNRENNVLFVEDTKGVLSSDDRIIQDIGNLNRKVFHEHFGPERWLRAYARVIRESNPM